MESVSVLDKLVDVKIKKESFVPEGQTEEIQYTRLELTISVGGEEETILFQSTKSEGRSAYGLIKASDVVEN